MESVNRAASRAGLFLTVLSLLWVSNPGVAMAESRAVRAIKKNVSEAMQNFDLLDFAAARKGLKESLLLAKKSGVEDDKVMAEVHLALAILQFSGFDDPEGAKLHFIDAVQLDSKIEIPVAYRTKKMDAILNQVRKDYGARTQAPPDEGSGDEDDPCKSAKGIRHTIVDAAEEGRDQLIEAQVSDSLGAKTVSLYFRTQGAVEFERRTMKKADGCTYRAKIPKSALDGDFVHYYLEVKNRKKKVVAKRGSSGSPNIIEVNSSTREGSRDGRGADQENPLGDGEGDVDDSEQVDDDDEPRLRRKRPEGDGALRKYIISVALGTGGAYVSGKTEQRESDVGCCFAPALLHVMPELGYALSERTTALLALRMGFPIGANLVGHATAAPSVLFRLRSALGASPDGLSVNAAVGAGAIRQTVKLSDGTPGMDTDTTVIGPFLLGGGASYLRPMGGPIKFVAEANAIAGLPLLSESGTCPGPGCVRWNFGIQVDINIGLMFAF